MHITTHPFDPSRVLTPMVTGRLPDSKPIIARGQVYCGHDFRQRAVAWLIAEQERLAAAAKAERKQKQHSTTPRTSTPPTRVQPPRAAKRKADDSSSAQPPKKKPRLVLDKTKKKQLTVATPDYTLAPAQHAISVARFKAELAAVLDTKQRPIVNGCRTPSRFPSPALSQAVSQVPSRGASPCPGHRTPRNLWCPIVAEPLACIDRAYCLHSIGRTAAAAAIASPTPTALSSTARSTTCSDLSRALSQRRSPAPEAAMTPPDTPPPEMVLQARAKEFAGLRHVQERTVEYGGLRFAVDVCDGSMRVWMV